jgi:hypothetical protein
VERSEGLHTLRLISRRRVRATRTLRIVDRLSIPERVYSVLHRRLRTVTRSDRSFGNEHLYICAFRDAGLSNRFANFKMVRICQE